jgi:hypothetical protein
MAGLQQKRFLIAFAQKDANRSEGIVRTLVEIAAQKSHATDILEARTKQAGVRNSYKRRERWLDIHSISRSDWSDEAYEQLADRVGEEHFEFLLFNEAAMAVAGAHFANLPPVIAEIGASDLPSNVRLRLHIPYPEFVPANSQR